MVNLEAIGILYRPSGYILNLPLYQGLVTYKYLLKSLYCILISVSRVTRCFGALCLFVYVVFLTGLVIFFFLCLFKVTFALCFEYSAEML